MARKGKRSFKRTKKGKSKSRMKVKVPRMGFAGKVMKKGLQLVKDRVVPIGKKFLKTKAHDFIESL
jgi:hypothetical protein